MKWMASLQARLTMLVCAGVCAVWTGTAAWTWFDARREVDDLLDSHLAQAASLLVAQLSHREEGDVDGDEIATHRYARKVSFQVWRGAALVLRSSTAPADGPMAPSAQGFQDVDMQGDRWRVFATTARAGERGEHRERHDGGAFRHGRGEDAQDAGAGDTIRVYVGERVDARRQILWVVTRALLVPLVIALPLLAGLVAAAVWQGLDPLRRLSRTLVQRSPAAIEPVNVGTPVRELDALVGALNSLLGRIGVLLQSERRFTADAAHELRTPLAALRAQAQVALAAADDATRARALQGTLQGCDRAAHLVDQLLLLSRLDNQALPTTGEADLAVVARRVLAEIAPAALDKRQSLELDGPPNCPVPGNEVLLAALLRNLVDNAVRYSPEGARIRVRVAGPGLVVDDSGPGLEAESLARLGERFFRAADRGESGTGLGWSIVRRIAEAHGLPVRTGPSPLGGLRVEVGAPLPAVD